jgi:hypothetical protein
LEVTLPLLLNAISLAPAARRWLQTSTAARVLHVFDSSCNLVNDRGAILSLVTPGLGNAPFAVLLVPAAGERRFSFAPLVDVHARVARRDGLLEIGSVAVAWVDAAVWRPQPRWELLRQSRSAWQRYLPVLATMLDERRAVAERTTSAGPVPPWQEAWAPPVALLRQGLVAGEPERCRTAAARLAGLGEGLTPLGDDFLLGVMVALWSYLPAPQAAPLAGIMAQVAGPRTTLLSGAWLEAAARGEVAASWHLLLEAFTGNEFTAVSRAARRILRTGHSSGVAALAGFLFAADVCCYT